MNCICFTVLSDAMCFVVFMPSSCISFLFYTQISVNVTGSVIIDLSHIIFCLT